MGIVESRDKGFVLDLKLLFTIVDCCSGRFPPKFFTVKLVDFIDFPRSSYLVLFIFPLHDFDMILMLFILTSFIHNKYNNLGLKLVNYINRGLNFPTLCQYQYQFRFALCSFRSFELLTSWTYLSFFCHDCFFHSI